MDQLLVSRNVLSYIQFGFRKDRSTSSLCSSLHTIGIFHLKSTVKWPVFFFDFAKAFESVPHQALLINWSSHQFCFNGYPSICQTVSSEWF